jgi:hypothetical protein
MNPVHNLPSYFPKSHSNITYNPRLCLLSGLFPSGFPTETQYAFLNSICAIWTAHLIFLDFITLTTFGEAYKLRSSSFCRLLQPPATSSRLGPDILHSILFSDTSRYVLEGLSVFRIGKVRIGHIKCRQYFFSPPVLVLFFTLHLSQTHELFQHSAFIVLDRDEYYSTERKATQKFLWIV